MQITPVIQQLRNYCPGFEGRVAGALELSVLLEDATPLLSMPAAYVVPTKDDGDKPISMAAYTQNIVEQFDVVVAVPAVDERGQAVADRLHALRAELFKALLGWEPDPDYEYVQYTEGGLLLLNRARVVWRWGFQTSFSIGNRRKGGPAATWLDVVRDGLPTLNHVHVDIDMMKPTGPDGKIEHVLDITPPTSGD